jgi:hypothetical protein
MTDPEARLAAAMHECDDDGCDGPYGSCDIAADYLREAHYVLRADPTIAADLALAAAVRDIEAEFHPLRAIAATSGPDGWEMTVEGYDLSGTIVYRSGEGQTLGEAFAAIEKALNHD